MEEIRLSVRDLVEFLLRGGSIDNRLGGLERAQEGGRIHRRLQKEAGEGYRAEVPLSIRKTYGELPFLIEGRADGLIRPAAGDPAFSAWEDAPASGDCAGRPDLIVDEIKTTLLPFDQLTADFNPSHWAQAMCYAYICAEKENLPAGGVQLTYFQAETEEVRYFRRRCSRAFLEEFFDGLLEKYKKWADWQEDWNRRRDQAAKALAFPFASYRPGQRQMAAAVYRAIRDGKRVFCQAPTGIGKSMSALFPAVKALGEGECEKIFYLTAKTVARQAAEDALGLLREKGAALKSVNLTAKDKICFLEERDCNPQACPYADGHFDRVNDALYALLTGCDAYTRQAVEEAARQYRVCPYELSLDLSLFCDCVVCDYNYLFDPEARLLRFFSGEGGDYAFLIDEAHNLVDRARSMYSASLRKSDFLALRRQIGRTAPKLTSALGRLNRAFLDVRKACLEENGKTFRKIPSREDREDTGVFTAPEPAPALTEAVAGFVFACEEWLARRPSPRPDWEPDLLERYFEALAYRRTLEAFDDAYTFCLAVGRRDVQARLLCLDPARQVSDCLDKGKGAVLFSATLSPLSYFQSLLGGKEAAALTLPSPFPPERLGLFAAHRISTRYKDRQAGYDRIAQLIYTTVSARPGHYMAYFPSYAYLEAVRERFQAAYPDFPLLVQQSDMDEAARTAFLRRFGEGGEGDALLGFCVLGGLYAEGVDLKGERLIGAVIVGVGLPQVNPWQEILKIHFDKEGKGFAYAYRYPGFHKVLQAAGRVIRDAADKGVVLLIDDRFVSGAYRRLYPAHWSHLLPVEDTDDLERNLRDFWLKDL